MRPENGRLHILQEVRDGRLDPEIAEELAVQLGWGELRPEPLASDFDPYLSRYWSFCQCVAFLGWGTATAVLLCDPAYARAFKIWRRLGASSIIAKSNLAEMAGIGAPRGSLRGWVLTEAVPPPLLWLLDREKRNVPPIPSLDIPRKPLEQSFHRMIASLQDGTLCATATNIRTNSTDVLSEVDWATCGFGMQANQHGQRIDGLFRSGQLAYCDINVRVDRLLAVFPQSTNHPNQSLAAPIRKTLGRKAKPIWAAFNAEVLRLYRDLSEPGQDIEGWEDQAAVERVMTIWLEDQGFPSATSTIRSRVVAALIMAREIVATEK